jgi:hypothetical protein
VVPRTNAGKPVAVRVALGKVALVEADNLRLVVQRAVAAKVVAAQVSGRARLEVVVEPDSAETQVGQLLAPIKPVSGDRIISLVAMLLKLRIFSAI